MPNKRVELKKSAVAEKIFNMLHILHKFLYHCTDYYDLQVTTHVGVSFGLWADWHLIAWSFFNTHRTPPVGTIIICFLLLEHHDRLQDRTHDMKRSIIFSQGEICSR